MNGHKQSGMRPSLHTISKSIGGSTVRSTARIGVVSPPEPSETKMKAPALPVRPVIDLWAHPERYITPAELARYWRVSTDTIYRDIKKGALPAYRIGSSGTIRIRIEDARRYGRPEV